MINYAILTTMAGAEGSKGENNEVRRAVDMLREAANLIDCSLQSGRNQGTTRVENSPTLSASTSVLNESCVETMAPTMTTTSTQHVVKQCSRTSETFLLAMGRGNRHQHVQEIKGLSNHQLNVRKGNRSLFQKKHGPTNSFV